MSVLKDRRGHRYGRLVVERYVGSLNGTGAIWRCQCDCGAVAVVLARSLRAGTTRSCGCYRADMNRARARRRRGVPRADYAGVR